MKKLLVSGLVLTSVISTPMTSVFAEDATMQNADMTRHAVTVDSARQAWKDFHCQAIKDGKKWEGFIASFINEQTCATNSLDMQTSMTTENTKEDVVKSEEMSEQKAEESEKMIQKDIVKQMMQRHVVNSLVLDFDEKMKQEEFMQKTSEEKYAELIDLAKKIQKELESEMLIDEAHQNTLARYFITTAYSFTKNSIEQISTEAKDQNLSFVTAYLERFKDASSQEFVFIESTSGFDFFLPRDKKSSESIIITPRTKYQDADFEDVSVELVNAPIWMRLSTNDGKFYSIKMDYDGNESVAKTFDFEVRVRSVKTNKTFTQKYTISLVDSHVMLKGKLGSSAGQLASGDTSFGVSVEENALSREYDVQFIAIPSLRGDKILMSLEVEGEIPETEKNAIKVNIPEEKIANTESMNLMKMFRK